jgi:myo-inositol-1(or 4)-monophosphatase
MNTSIDNPGTHAAISIETVSAIAKTAGQILLDHKHDFEELSKGDGYDVGTIVTSADIASEKAIVEKIHENFPTHGIFGEEGTRENLTNEYVWYIDPLDGTAAYARDFPFWGGIPWAYL